MQLLDVLGITVFVGVLTALLMPAPGESRFEKMLPAGSLGRAAFGSALLVGLFLAAFSPALAVHALGFDTEVAYRKSPYKTVPLYGQIEGYPKDMVDNFDACATRGPALMPVQHRRDPPALHGQYRAIEARIARRGAAGDDRRDERLR